MLTCDHTSNSPQSLRRLFIYHCRYVLSYRTGERCKQPRGAWWVVVCAADWVVLAEETRYLGRARMYTTTCYGMGFWPSSCSTIMKK